MYKFQSVGQDQGIQPLPAATNPYCENLLPNMCVKEQRVLDKAKQDCRDRELRNQTRGLFGSLGKTCTLYASDAQVGMSHYNLWDPCMLSQLPLCGGGTPNPPGTDVPTTVDTPSDTPETTDEDDESDSGQFMVGGILGLLVLGGIGYAIFKNRKKKKKSKR
jgi:hypothetical protein